MAPSTKGAAPAQHQQPSRKGKKAWRKNVDITAVQDGLETVRDEVIQGGVIAEKPSTELFVLDTQPSAQLQQRVRHLVKPLKADQILAQRSAVPAVTSRIVAPAGVTDGVIAKKRRTGGVSRAHYERLRARAHGRENARKTVTKEGTAQHDPWAETKTVANPALDFIPSEEPIKAPSTLREAPVSLLQGGRALPAVPRPRAGTSYNPTYDEWEALIAKEGAKAVVVEQQRLEDERLERERAEKIAAARRDELAWATEDDSAWEGFGSATEPESGEEHRATKLPRRKTPTERNRVKRRKEREGKRKHSDAMQKRGEREARRKEEEAAATEKSLLVTEVAESEDDTDEETIHERVLRRRPLGKDRIPAPDLELTLPDELQDSLRRLKPEGNLLRERFHNLLVRGHVETRRPAGERKKPRRKDTEKWTYKDFEVPGMMV